MYDVWHGGQSPASGQGVQLREILLNPYFRASNRLPKMVIMSHLLGLNLYLSIIVDFTR